MFERFTEQARQVVVLAQEEARSLKHNYIGTEHVLLGLLRQDDGIAAWVLGSLHITVERVRAQVVGIVGSGEEITSGQIPFTPRVKKVFELALRESLSLKHNYIGTEHILLGLAREDEGVASRIMLDHGADSETLRNEVLRMLSASPSSPRSSVSQLERAVAEAFTFGGLQRVLALAAAETLRAGDRDADAGDLLIGLAELSDPLVARTLEELGRSEDDVRTAVERARRPDDESTGVRGDGGAGDPGA